MEKLPSHLYGESIFTTAKSVAGKVVLIDAHLKRLFEQVSDYYFLKNKDCTELITYFEAREKLENFAKLHPNHGIRMTVFADARAELVPSYFSLSELNLEFSAREITTRSALKLKTMPSPFSENFANIKAGSYFQNFYFKRKSMDQSFDDVLFFHVNTITEASSSNIIMGNGSVLFTPKHASIFSGLGLELLRASGMRILEKEIKLNELASFDSCYLVNSVNWLSPVEKIDDKVFTNNHFESMLERINKYVRSTL